MENRIFDRAAALALADNDEGVLAMLLDSFARTAFSLGELDALVRAKDYAAAAAYVHKAKGAGRQLCMGRLAQSGQELEDVLRGKKDGDVGLLSRRMAAEHALALEAAARS